MKYRLYQIVEGVSIKSEFTGANVVEAMAVRGYKFAGGLDRPGIREELRHQPKFSGVLGPMWDGDGIRYESQEVYDQMSM